MICFDFLFLIVDDWKREDGWCYGRVGKQEVRFFDDSPFCMLSSSFARGYFRLLTVEIDSLSLLRYVQADSFLFQCKS